MAKFSPEQRLKMAGEKTSLLVDHVSHLVRLHEANRIITYSDKLSSQVPTARHAVPYADFQSAMHFFEIIRLCAIWDGRSEDRVSIPTVRDLLDDDKVLALADRQILDGWKSFGKLSEFECLNAQRVASKLRAVMTAAKRIEASKRYQRLKSFRDKFLAHSLSSDKGLGLPKYGDERRLAQLSVGLIHGFYLGLRNTDFAFDQTVQMARRDASSLWENCRFQLIAGLPAQ